MAGRWVALVFVGAAQIVFWTIAYPINVATEGWTALPVDFDTARRQWEHAFAAAGVLSFAGLLALVRSIEDSRPFASMSILEVDRARRGGARSAHAGTVRGRWPKPLEAALTPRNRAA